MAIITTLITVAFLASVYGQEYAVGSYDCSGNESPSDNSCSNHASWKQCGEAWMTGFCCTSCSAACSSTCDSSSHNTGSYQCSEDESPSDYTCSQHSSWNQCGEDWMTGFCCSSCSSTCSSSCDSSSGGGGGGSSSSSGTGIVSGKYLSVNTNRKVFRYNGRDLFLNGANQPWVNYGNDFGGSRASDVQSKLEQELVRISNAGGNVVRMWVFCEGKYLPIFNSDGSVSKSDSSNSLGDDIIKYLDAAQQYNVFVILSLWNGAVDFNGNGLYKMLTQSGSTSKMQTFIDRVLTPLVNKVSYHPALGGWEIINEPEGSLQVASGWNDCTNTNFLSGKGPPWTDASITAWQFQRFINRQASAIHSADSKALVTVGTWSEWTSTDVYGKNLWKDSCLSAAGGKSNGYLDFYQIHSYAWQDNYNQYSPFKVSSVDVYQLSKPVIIGELGVVEGGGTNPTTMAQKYQYLYNAGFNGALAWAMNDYSCGYSDGPTVVTQGIRALSSKWNVAVGGSSFTAEDDGESSSNGLNTTGIVVIIVSSLLCVFCVICIVGMMYRKKNEKKLKIVEDAVISSNSNDATTLQKEMVAEESRDDTETMEVEIEVEAYDETPNATNDTIENDESQ